MSNKPCINCGSIPTELHHVIPKSLGGQDIESNLVPLCSKCHALIHGLNPETRGIQKINGSINHGLLVKTGQKKAKKQDILYDQKLHASILASKEINKQIGKSYGGKPRISIDINQFKQEYAKWKNGQQTAKKTMENLNLKPNTFYRRVKDFEQTGQLDKSLNFPSGNFCNDCYRITLGEFTLAELAKKYYLKPNKCIDLADSYGYKIY